ncbi:galectin-2 [Pterocles gutturalis]
MGKEAEGLPEKDVESEYERDKPEHRKTAAIQKETDIPLPGRTLVLAHALVCGNKRFCVLPDGPLALARDSNWLSKTSKREKQMPELEEKFEIFNLGMKTGDSLKIKGKISEDADGFSINLGCSNSDLAFHFNPRFNESVIVCNSRCSSAWQAEHRDDHLCFSRGSTVKMVIEMLADKFQVKLPDGHEVEFPNRHSYDKISYMNIKGGFRVTSFKLD